MTFEYDDNGNMTQKAENGAATLFFYNAENRLQEVKDTFDNTIATYYYDPFGRRLWKDVGGVRTYFHYADEGLVGEYESSGNQIKEYGYKPDSIWTTDPLFIKKGSVYYFYHNDHLHTPYVIISTNGMILWSAKYNSFGQAYVDVEIVKNNLRFPGQYFDEETELYYNRHRFYDSSGGRYCQHDPIGNIGGINLFLYVKNNPINYYDNIGLLTRGLTKRERQRIIDKAESWQGVPYDWGGNSRETGIDCSHFVQKIYEEVGHSFKYMDTRNWERYWDAKSNSPKKSYFAEKSPWDCEDGDLILWQKYMPDRPGHMGIYNKKKDQSINSRWGVGVTYNKLDRWEGGWTCWEFIIIEEGCEYYPDIAPQDPNPNLG